jgi:Hint domain
MVTLPSNLTTSSITITEGVIVTVPDGGVVTGNVSVQFGQFNVGVSSAGTGTAVIGNVVIYGSGGATVTGNANITGSIDINPHGDKALVSLVVAPGATLTTSGVSAYYGTSGQSNHPDDFGFVQMGNGATVSIPGTLLAANAEWMSQLFQVPTGSATLQFDTVDNGGFTLPRDADPALAIETNNIIGGSLLPNQFTGLPASSIGVQFLGDAFVPKGVPAPTLIDASGYGQFAVQGNLNAGGKIGKSSDALTFNLQGGTVDGISSNPLTLEPGSVINVQSGFSGTASANFASATTLAGALFVKANFDITESAPPLLFAAGSYIEVDRFATLEIDAPVVSGQGFDNESTILINGGNLLIDQAPINLGTIQFYDVAFGITSTLRLGNSSLGTSFDATGALLDFSAGDTIIFNGATFGASAQVALSGNTLTVTDQTGTAVGDFTLSREDSQTYVQSEFTLAAVAGGMQLAGRGAIFSPIRPTVSVSSSKNGSYHAPGPAVIADSSVIVGAAVGSIIAGGTVAITSNFVSGDTLAFADQNGITGSYDAAHGVLTLSGTATLAQYSTAMSSVTYAFTPGADPTLGGGVAERILSWSVNNGTVTSIPVTSTLSEHFTRPTLSFGGTISYPALGAPIVLDGTTAMSDINASVITGATIEIFGGVSGDLLSATTMGTGITAAYDGTAEVLTLSGTDTIADYVNVLDTVAFSSTAADPTAAGNNLGREFDASLVDSIGNVAANAAFASVLCFAAGTRIATEDGEMPVERLAIGQRVRTMFAGLAPVVWIGRRSIDCRRHPSPRLVWPVRIAAGAFGSGAPKRDLYLSPDHAVFLDNVLIPVKRLIDGEAIAQAPVDRVDYFHVEFQHHDAVFAEGLAAESYLETGERWKFANGEGLGPSSVVQLVWEAAACAPLVVAGPVLRWVRARLPRRAV